MSIIGDSLSRVLALPPVPAARPVATHNRRLAGWSDCYVAMFGDATFPPKRWEVDVAGYLFERKYHPESIRCVLDHAGSHGTAQCCSELAFCDTDRDHVESLLPDATIGNWERAEYAGTWSATA